MLRLLAIALLVATVAGKRRKSEWTPGDPLNDLVDAAVPGAAAGTKPTLRASAPLPSFRDEMAAEAAAAHVGGGNEAAAAPLAAAAPAPAASGAAAIRGQWGAPPAARTKPARRGEQHQKPHQQPAAPPPPEPRLPADYHARGRKCAAPGACTDGCVVTPGAFVWRDTAGRKIECHGGGFVMPGQAGAPTDRYLWYGETSKEEAILFPERAGVNLYSSFDLAHWHFEGTVLTQAHFNGTALPASQAMHKGNADEGADYVGPWKLERPKVVWCAKTKRFVLWVRCFVVRGRRRPRRPPLPPLSQVHVDHPANNVKQWPKYAIRHVGVATARAPAGPWTLKSVFKPDGHHSLDLTLHQDPVSGDAYLARVIREGHSDYIAVSRLDPTSMTDTVGGVVSTVPTEEREAPAMFVLNGKLRMLASEQSGWLPNSMDARMGPEHLNDTKAEWPSLGNPTVHPDYSNGAYSRDSLNTQPTAVISHCDAAGKPYLVYVGDRWNFKLDETLKLATYVFLPVEVEDSTGRFAVRWRASWNSAYPWGL